MDVRVINRELYPQESASVRGMKAVVGPLVPEQARAVSAPRLCRSCQQTSGDQQEGGGIPGVL